MKKLILIGTALAALAPAATASAVTVADPTPNGAFTGSYTYHCGTTTCTGTQAGYVSADSNGVVACNGQAHEGLPSQAGDLQGFVWIGPGNAASNPVGAAPGNVAGAGDNQNPADDSGAPCAQQPAPGSVG